jgi:hypothetical protein
MECHQITSVWAWAGVTATQANATAVAAASLNFMSAPSLSLRFEAASVLCAHDN